MPALMMDPTTGQLVPVPNPQMQAVMAAQQAQSPWLTMGANNGAMPAQPAPQPPPMAMKSARMVPMPNVSPLLGDKAYGQVVDRLNNSNLDALNQQQGGIDDQKKLIDNLKNSFQQKTNYAPLLALADSWTGSNLGKGYEAPETQTQRQTLIAQLQDHLQKSQQGLTDTQVKLMKDQLDSKYAAQQMKLLAGGMNSAKSGKDQDKAMQNVQQLLESARGNPAASQAEKDIYAAQKANSLTNLYGDPNKLSQSQVNLLTAEIGKIASGGQSTQAELDGLSPGTLNGKLSSVWGKLQNAPTPANAGAFIKQYQDYANALTGDAQKVISDKYGRIIESRKHQLGDDNYGLLKAHYLDRFTPQPAPASAPPAGPQAGTVQDGFVFKGGDPSDQKNWVKQ
jgi:hypothetical protein